MPFQSSNRSWGGLSIEQHLLAGDDTSQVSSPNTSGTFAAGFPDTIVIHFTAGSSLSSSVNVMTNPSNKVSAHIAIGRSGEIVQMVPFDKIAWHAGKSYWQGRTRLNQYAIGIELDNAGQLTANDEGYYTSWFGGVFNSQDVYKGVHRNQHAASYWHRYAEAQIMRTFALCQVLCQHYNIKSIVGHEEIAPERKVDPGPAFPLDKLRSRLLGDTTQPKATSAPPSQQLTASSDGIQGADEPQNVQDGETVRPAVAVVSASKLNVRSGPGTAYDKQGLPLVAGEKVAVLSVQNGWAKVARTTAGWVSEDYLAMVEDAKEDNTNPHR